MNVPPLSDKLKTLIALLLIVPCFQLQAAFEAGAAFDPGVGPIQAVEFDATSGRVYAAAGKTVSSVDAADGGNKESLEFAGDVSGLTLIGTARRGVASLGGAGSIQIFDMDSMETVSSIDVSGSPGASVYDSATGRVFVADTASAQLFVLEDLAGDAVATHAISGTGGSMVVDQRGFLYGVLQGQPNLFILDTRSLQNLGSFQLPACSTAIDIANDMVERRLFVPCDNGYLFAVDPDTGLILSRLAIAPGASAVGVDFEDNRMLNIFVASSTGGLTLGRVEKVTFTVAGTLEDLPAGSDLAVDDATGRVYLSSGTQLNIVQPENTVGATP